MRDFFWRLPTLRCAAVSVLAYSASCAVAATGLSWKQGSDLLAVGLPALAAGTAWGQGDTEGLRQLSWALGTTVAATEATKAAFPSQRPDGSDDKSFPSGHTAVAFAAVRFMDKRYGAEMAPYTPWLYAAAGLTGWARVEARKHRWGDVAAGAALGFGAAHYWTEPVKGGQLSVLPAAQGLTVMWHRPW
jgi:membrane-associated phospholipid phosphatase